MNDNIHIIADRMRRGIDCTESESSLVLGYFDQYDDEDAAVNDDMAGLFPLEFEQWCREKSQGLRS